MSQSQKSMVSIVAITAIVILVLVVIFFMRERRDPGLHMDMGSGSEAPALVA